MTSGNVWYPLVFYDPVERTAGKTTGVQVVWSAIPEGAIPATSDQIRQWINKLDFNAVNQSVTNIFTNGISPLKITQLVLSGKYSMYLPHGNEVKVIDTASPLPTDTTQETNPQPQPQPVTNPQPQMVTGLGDPITNFIAAVTNLLAPPLNTIGTAAQGVSNGVQSIQTSVDGIRQKAVNLGDNVVELVNWIGTPSTLERVGAIILGLILFIIGLQVFTMSFVDMKAVTNAAITVAKVAA